ncbi:hypothetical protein PZB75_20125 [Streptomyces sp. AM 4-1-1]|nr:hypothetical protein [Streptomyces sp. AM 4-1-1]WEH35463.1 hypothetical protein PZB75_20125 [Streptomyces sp. AM 4-1-1]
MPRHEVRPGRAVAGVVMLALAGCYAAEAAGAWSLTWYFFVPLLCGGLSLAATATWLSYGLRRRSEARRASAENTGAPASSSGSQAMR